MNTLRQLGRCHRSTLVHFVSVASLSAHIAANTNAPLEECTHTRFVRAR